MTQLSRHDAEVQKNDVIPSKLRRFRCSKPFIDVKFISSRRSTCEFNLRTSHRDLRPVPKADTRRFGHSPSTRTIKNRERTRRDRSRKREKSWKKAGKSYRLPLTSGSPGEST
ncbi:hypothetical protein AVEN_146427-1 [Araneus ventricosus]|uniref:Uncharacterized protein n=1 Tax=Araneus ventricosus TaxID=182803 RepID=A0A4Y2NEF3_ARAVE|nr:hypothetical protein AVEN_146427-1 [Araneus ventricosus]